MHGAFYHNGSPPSCIRNRYPFRTRRNNSGEQFIEPRRCGEVVSCPSARGEKTIRLRNRRCITARPWTGVHPKKESGSESTSLFGEGARGHKADAIEAFARPRRCSSRKR